MRALTRLGIVVESISKFARELERYHPGLHEQISKEVIRRYVDREGNGAFANTAPSVSKRRLGEAGQDLLALVLQFRDTAAAKLSSFAILERVLRDQFEIVDDECGDRDAKRAAIRDPKDVPCDTVGNPADPDASYNAHKGQGYMAQIVETYCEDDSNEAVAATPDLITHVEVHKMTVHDGHRLADALDDLSERALTPAVMLGDSHYGSSDNMALTREQNINLVAPARPPKGAVSGRLTLEDFTLNEEGLVLRCPNNVEPVSASLAKAKLQARFDLSICQKCPDILRCPVQAAKRDGQFSRFQYTPARARAVQRSLLRVIAEQPVESADGISISRVGHVGDVVGAHDVGGETADASENAGVFADATGVLAHGDITRIVVPVFNPPVCPDGAAGGVGGEHGVRHVVGGFAGQVPEAGRGVAFEAAAVDPNDGGDKGCPFGVAEMGARIEDLDVARLVSRPRGVDGLMAVERLALVA